MRKRLHSPSELRVVASLSGLPKDKLYKLSDCYSMTLGTGIRESFTLCEGGQGNIEASVH